MGKVCAIILAGGKGTRMGYNIPKQFININDKPMIYYTINAFQKIKLIDEIIVVLPKTEMQYFNDSIHGKYDLKIDKIVEGGVERKDSVYNALKEIDNCDIVLIHDGARPFVSEKIITDGINFAKNYGACAPGVMPKDTIKIKNSNNISKSTPNRLDLLAVQTPQCFKYDIIMNCHEKIKNENINITDDTMVVEHFNKAVYLYEGDYNNIKITTPEDLILANYFTRIK